MQLLLSCVLLASVVLLSAAPAGAKGSRKEREHLSERLIEEHALRLGLDQQTLAAIRAIAEASRQQEAELGAALRRAYATLRELLAEETPDADAVMRQAEAIGALDLVRHKNRLRVLLQIRAILTPEQRQELVRIHQEASQRRLSGILRACRSEVTTFCTDAAEAHARMRCLREHEAALSATCRSSLRSRDAHRKPSR